MAFFCAQSPRCTAAWMQARICLIVPRPPVPRPIEQRRIDRHSRQSSVTRPRLDRPGACTVLTIWLSGLSRYRSPEWP
jgi:hypothetical protein